MKDPRLCCTGDRGREKEREAEREREREKSLHYRLSPASPPVFEVYKITVHIE